MDGRVLLLFLLVLGASRSCSARELLSTLFPREIEISDVSVVQINNQESESEVQVLEEVGRIEVCTLCEEFSAEELNYFSENKTETQIIEILHKSCAKIPSFEQQCITLVDYYAPLFFLEISSIQPEDFCRNVGLCQQILVISQHLSKDRCRLCHDIVTEVLLKLKDPDTQLEIIKLLLKACDAVENSVKKCKTMVFEYAPLILINAEQFLDKHDICSMLHACDLPTADTKKVLLTKAETYLLSKY